MKARRVQPARYGLYLITAIWLLILLPLSALAAPYAAYVIDARTGEVLHAANADTRLHPASLTKMMTLYIAFEAVKQGEITLDTKVRISKNAAAEPPSKLGLRPGQEIALRYLIRAAAVKSANDAATAIGEAIEGSEAKFARRMNRTAKALGMTRTTFKNMHGLTEAGHLSTARDMTIMGRHLLYDYPQYYNLFSRVTADAGVRKVSHTNRRFLNDYRGADGIKTGYTRAAGFNLTASAERGNERIIVTVFGGNSTSSRNAKVAELMDLGFRRAPSRAPLRKPTPPSYGSGDGPQGKTIRLHLAVKESLRPQLRPGSEPPLLVASATPVLPPETATPVEPVVSTPT
jgi:D-alanyl-D-alanine carboxypeptidase